ncbi:hypothetical protein G3I66_43115, partial [Streptomyces rubrogriseus]|nr:hypothetical protein [Streptomyces rubrogriseus]
MPTDRPGPPDPPPLPLLADLLGRAAATGARPTPLELAELLWLAGRMEPPEQDPPHGPATGTRPAEPPPVPEGTREQGHEGDGQQERERDRKPERDRHADPERDRNQDREPGQGPWGDGQRRAVGGEVVAGEDA